MVTKKTVEVSQEIQETPEIAPEKREYRALIEKYKEQNPVKYEQKKAEFDRKLRGDIRIETDKLGNRKTFIFSNTPKE